MSSNETCYSKVANILEYSFKGGCLIVRKLLSSVIIQFLNNHIVVGNLGPLYLIRLSGLTTQLPDEYFYEHNYSNGNCHFINSV